MRLLLDIALAHVRGRARQSAVSIAGVALGVGFSVGMAALMQGSQDEFMGSLVDAMPHVQITDERRAPPPQPAEAHFDAVAFHGLRPRDDPRGILNPVAATASLRGWAPGALLGCLLGYGLTALMGSVKFEMTQEVEVTHLPVVYEPLHYVIACAVAMGAAAVAGWLPARKAARANPVDIIRGAT